MSKKVDKDKERKKRKHLEEKLIDHDGVERYPYANMSYSLYKVISILVKVALITLVLKVVPLLFEKVYRDLIAPILDSFSIFIKAIFVSFDTNQSIVTVDSFINTKLLPFMDNIIKVSFILSLVLLVPYLYSIIMRKHYGEEQVFKNDALARRIKNRVIHHQLKIKITEDMAEHERLALQKLKAMKVGVHTRKEVRGDKFFTKAKIIIEQPLDEKELKYLESVTSDFSRILHKASKGVLNFRQMRDTAQRFLIFESASKDETAKYQAIIDKHMARKNKNKNKEKKDPNQYCFPLSFLANPNLDIESKKEDARVWARETAKSLDMYFVSVADYAVMQSMDVGNTSASFTYEMSDFKKSSNPSTIENNLVSLFNTQDINVTMKAGRIVIEMSLPDECKVSIPMDKMFEEVFG